MDDGGDPTPIEILEQMASNCLSHIENLALASFQESINSMTDYHLFFLQCLNRSYHKKGDSFALLDDSMIPIYQSLNKQYRRLFERSAVSHTRDPDFIRELFFVPFSLYSRAPFDVPNSIRTDFLLLARMAYFYISDWARNEISGHFGYTPDLENVHGISGMLGEQYRETIREFVSAWEMFPFYIQQIHNWETSDANPKETWDKFAESRELINVHMKGSGYLLLASLRNGDATACDHLSDMFVKWLSHFDIHLGEGAIFRIEELTIDSLRESWEKIQSYVSSNLNGLVRSPSAVMHSVVRNLWVDTAVILLGVGMKWLKEVENKAEAGSRFNRIYRGYAFEQDSVADHGGTMALVDPDDILCSMIRQHRSNKIVPSDRYCNTLDHLVAEFDTLSEGAVTPGRGFTPSSMRGRRDLLIFECVILLAAFGNRHGNARAFRRAAKFLRSGAVFENSVESDLGAEPLSRIVGILETIDFKQWTRELAAVFDYNPSVEQFEEDRKELIRVLQNVRGRE